MISTTEVFVMIIYIIGLPLFAGVVQSANLPGAKTFLIAYFFLMLSNIFTVIEDVWCAFWCNLFEHACITISSIFFFLAVRTLIASRAGKNSPSNSGRAR